MNPQPTALPTPAPLRFSPTGIALLKRFEGFRSRTYRDIAGLRTIGYGHRLLPGESFPGGVTESEAAELLARDIGTAERAVRTLIRSMLSQGRFDALVDFVFNLGAGKLASSTLLKDVNSGNFAAAGEQLLRWDHSGVQESAGLKTRRAAEFELWNAGSEPTERAA